MKNQTQVVNKKHHMKTINFSVPKQDMTIIIKIAKRAVAMAKKAKIAYEFIDCDMDITACHANGNPLKLQELLDADDFNFAHDVFGIRRHIDRQTGQLTGCFVPRFSAPETPPASTPLIRASRMAIGLPV
jgi:hypothetical protein